MALKNNERRETTERKELPNQESIKTLLRKNYKYSGILEADTVKHERKSKKRVSQKKTSRNQSLLQKSQQRNKQLGKLFWTFLKVDKGGTQTNRPKHKDIDDYAQGLTPERWPGQILSSKKRRRKRTHEYIGLPRCRN